MLPTQGGLVYAGILAAMLTGSINYDNSLGYALTFLLAGLAVVSILHTHRNLRGLVFRPGQPRPVFSGEVAQFPTLIDNPAARTRFSVSLLEKGGTPVVFDVPSQGNFVVEFPRTSVKRGLFPLERLTVETRFPLGLIRAWANLQLDQHCLVYPQPEGTATPAPSSLATGDASGSGIAAAHEDFASLRPYRSGDSLRQVHWKALAREQGLVSKEFEGEAKGELWLEWDRLGGLDTERRISRLCRWVLTAEQEGWIYGMTIPGRRILPGRGQAHVHRCLEALALLDISP